MSVGDTGSAQDSNPVTSEAIVDDRPEHRPTVATELLRAEAGDVQAASVEMERAGAEHITAERLLMTNSGARTVDARSAQIERSGILAVNSEKAVFSNSTSVFVRAEEARIVRGAVFALKAENATIEGDAKIAIYAGPASEKIRPVVDASGAAAFGAAFAVVILFSSAILRRIFRART